MWWTFRFNYIYYDNLLWGRFFWPNRTFVLVICNKQVVYQNHGRFDSFGDFFFVFYFEGKIIIPMMMMMMIQKWFINNFLLIFDFEHKNAIISTIYQVKNFRTNMINHSPNHYDIDAYVHGKYYLLFMLNSCQIKWKHCNNKEFNFYWFVHFKTKTEFFLKYCS